VSPLLIVLIVVGVLLLVLFLGGLIAAARRQRAQEGHLRRQLERANAELAQAHAQDKGWDRAVLEDAARAAAGSQVEQLDLVLVEDRPGTEEDRAVFRVVSGGRESRLVLGRRDGGWARE
jgi:type II secretory pathway pseudopilin PulG